MLYYKQFCKVRYESFIKMDLIKNLDYISALAGVENEELIAHGYTL